MRKINLKRPTGESPSVAQTSQSSGPRTGSVQENNQTAELKMQLADSISQSLLFSLERQYLEVPFSDATYIQSVPSAQVLVEQPSFLRLEQVGQESADNKGQPFVALQTALEACHLPGRYNLQFLVASDGRQNSVYLGGRSLDSFKFPVEDFTENLQHFFQGNWPGTRMSACTPEDAEFQQQILSPLNSNMRFATAVTGIPSLKSDDGRAYPQSLDRLFRGLRGIPFMYMVVAEPIVSAQVNDIIFRCRDLLGRVHTLTKMNLTETIGESIAEGTSKGSSTTEGVTTGESISVTNGIDMLAGGFGKLATIFPPLGFAGQLAGIVPAAGGLLGWERTTGRTRGTSTSRGTTTGESQTLTNNTSEAIGQEYINAHAQAVELQLQDHMKRFEKARAMGCWNVGVYFVAERPDIAERCGMQLRALLSGQKSIHEPIRVHDLKRAWSDGVQNALQNLEQPNLRLVTDPGSNHRQALEHPLGPNFEELTTPVTTEELALLVNLPRREVPGVKVLATSDFSLNVREVDDDDIQLGAMLESAEPTSLIYPISQKTLSKHALLVGITGSGKSTTCRRLLNEVYRHETPFLVIEPAKDEYVEWAMETNAELAPDDPNRISIFMPGVKPGEANRWRNS